jgi:hypothetical protein
MCTMHSMLRDTALARARVVDVLLLLTSGCLAALTFVGTDVLAYLGLSEVQAKVTLGCASTIVFVLGLAASRVDWKAAAERHARAAATLGDLKVKGRALMSPAAEDSPQTVREYLRQAATIAGTVAEVPERHFLRLKAAHLQKRAFSKLLDRFFALPVWYLRIRLALRQHARIDTLLEENK